MWSTYLAALSWVGFSDNNLVSLLPMFVKVCCALCFSLQIVIVFFKWRSSVQVVIKKQLASEEKIKGSYGFASYNGQLTYILYF